MLNVYHGRTDQSGKLRGIPLLPNAGTQIHVTQHVPHQLGLVVGRAPIVRSLGGDLPTPTLQSSPPARHGVLFFVRRLIHDRNVRLGGPLGPLLPRSSQISFTSFSPFQGLASCLQGS